MQLLYWMAVGLEYGLAFIAAVIGYSVLASTWEGYYGHRFLQTMHVLTMILISTVLPYGDFLLHLGYRQRGYTVKANEEPFPDSFELPRDY